MCPRLAAISAYRGSSAKEGPAELGEARVKTLVGEAYTSATEETRDEVYPRPGGWRRLPEFILGKLGESYDVQERSSTAGATGQVQQYRWFGC